MSAYQLDFCAVLLDQESIKQLNVFLSPNHILHRDVRSVAGSLGFSSTDIAYINSKPYPFVYMYDQWLKRHKRDAKLSNLLDAVREIKRFDAVEIIEKAIQVLSNQDPKDLLKIEDRYFSTLQRSISCATLSYETSNLEYEKERNTASGTYIPNILRLPVLHNENPDTKSPDVFVVYYPDDENLVQNVVRFVIHLRKKGIDATTDMFDSESVKDRGFYIYSKLLESQFVFVVCSPKFNEYSSIDAAEKNDSAKEVAFTMNHILKEIFENAGKNGKFIPVLMPHGKEEDVPLILKGSTIYKMKTDFNDLRRRVFGIEKYKLAPLPATRPNMKPKIIGSGNGLLKTKLFGKR